MTDGTISPDQGETEATKPFVQPPSSPEVQEALEKAKGPSTIQDRVNVLEAEAQGLSGGHGDPKSGVNSPAPAGLTAEGTNDVPAPRSKLDEIRAEEAEKNKRFADRVWKYVQQEAQGIQTEMTRPGLSTFGSVTVANAAKEGLFPDRETMEKFYKELEKWTSVGDEKWQQDQASRLLNELRIAQGKPPVIPAPPQTPEPVSEVRKGLKFPRFGKKA